MTAENPTSRRDSTSIRGFLVLSRLPFLLPGLASFITGLLIAVGFGHDPDAGLSWMCVIGLALIMLTTYYFNEYFDYEGDRINKTFTKFSGGSRALTDLDIPRPVARLAGWSSIGLLMVIALVYLFLHFEDYPLLLPLALFGAFCGIFYSHPPFQWAYQGIGEIMIGGCYGILAMVSGFYVASRELNLDIVLVSIPASLTIFGVIVANEFPDYEADKAVNKRNLMVRLGLKKGSLVFVAAMALTYPFMAASIAVGISPWILVFGLPVLLFCAVSIVETLKGGYEKPASQTRIAAATLLANLLSSLMFVPVVLIW
ncbi:MAG: prenyltransferase [Candidatus Thermoplasmatota archaeon]|nr:prenyltransferase [Candidatus Thermoplasmatota archaeon]